MRSNQEQSGNESLEPRQDESVNWRAIFHLRFKNTKRKQSSYLSRNHHHHQETNDRSRFRGKTLESMEAMNLRTDKPGGIDAGHLRMIVLTLKKVNFTTSTVNTEIENTRNNERETNKTNLSLFLPLIFLIN